MADKEEFDWKRYLDWLELFGKEEAKPEGDDVRDVIQQVIHLGKVIQDK